jgi:hypothetical protein
MADIDLHIDCHNSVLVFPPIRGTVFSFLVWTVLYIYQTILPTRVRVYAFKLIPRNRVLPEKVPGTQLVKNFSSYVSRKFTS